MRFCVIVFALCLTTSLNAQQISITPPSLYFDTVLVNTRDSISFRIRNASSDTLRVTDINSNKSAFSVRDTAFTILPADSVDVRVYFQTNQNVTWNDFLLIENAGARGTLPVRVIGTAKYSGSSYAATQGLWENDLKSVLLNLITNHTVLGYNTARDRMCESVDDPLGNDTLECVYTGRKIYARTRTEAQNQNFNAEHTWPQSTFSENDPMRSDLNHLYPTDEPANSQRANYPFGPVISNITWQVGGSKLGRNPSGLTAFEPRDVHKGDVARAVFYFLLRYPSNYGSFVDVAQEYYLRQWLKSDPVSVREAQRNNAVATYQGKRNPLIDHPEFADRITYFRSALAPQLQPDIVASPSAMQFGTVAVGDSSEWRLAIVNRGREVLTVSSISLQSASPAFRILDAPASIPTDSCVQVRVRFRPDQAQQTYSNAIVIQSNAPDQPSLGVTVSASSSGANAVAILPLPSEIVLHQNYPNPFNPATTISFSITRASDVTLKIYDVLGEEVATLLNARLNPGGYNMVWNGSRNATASGVYVYRLSVNGSVYSKAMVLLK